MVKGSPPVSITMAVHQVAPPTITWDTTPPVGKAQPYQADEEISQLNVDDGKCSNSLN